MFVLSIATIVLVVGAGICNAVMDTLKHHYEASIFNKYNENFWNPEKSWKNKWGWDYNKGKPKPKYWGSTTFLVFTTDAWHLFQFLQLKCIFGALSLWTNISPYGIVDFIILHLVYTVIFEWFYSDIFFNKK